MKRQLLFVVLVFSTSLSFSQTIDAGRKLMYYERWIGAEENFEQMIEKDPSNMEAYYWLTEVLIEEKKLDEASLVQQQLKQYLSNNPKAETPMIKISEAELYLQSGDTASAISIFEEIRRQTKEKEPDVLMGIARAWMHTKTPDYSRIFYLLEKAEKKDKGNPAIFSLRGDVHRRLSEGGKAVQSYQQAMQKDGTFGEAAYKIGKIYLTQANVEMYLPYFNKAVAMDPAYAPAYYELYYYYYFRDVNRAQEFLDKYIAHSDPSPENDYMVTDLLFASSRSKEAIEKATSLLSKEGTRAKPRLYKLIAYSYDALGDSVNALYYLQQYFQKEVDSNYVAKDYELRAKLLGKFPGNEQAIVQSLERAMEKDTLVANRINYATQLVAAFKKNGDKKSEAKWLGELYKLKENPTNLDLYYWGMAHFSAGEYNMADSVFAKYTEKYPEHVQGFYWRAKSNALIDSTMENGMAIPHYQKVIEMASADSLKNKSLLIQSYGYVGAYEANVKKDFAIALQNFEKILVLDPGNADALRYRDILKKWVNEQTESGPRSTDEGSSAGSRSKGSN